MGAGTWVKSNVDYGRRLVESGMAGAECAGKEFLHKEPLCPFLGESARKALKFSTAAACLGTGLAFVTKAHRKKALDTVAFAIAGAAFGFAAGVTWESRRFLASMTRQAIKDVNATRDEHWLEKNPIDYA
jgi:hypothetical protein